MQIRIAGTEIIDGNFIARFAERERGFIDVPKTTPVIQAFREAGYEIAIDDFGTGYFRACRLCRFE
jgi:sensor c-di-GMP phosphodiesterase-like protein